MKDYNIQSCEWRARTNKEGGGWGVGGGGGQNSGILSERAF